MKMKKELGLHTHTYRDNMHTISQKAEPDAVKHICT